MTRTFFPLFFYLCLALPLSPIAAAEKRPSAADDLAPEKLLATSKDPLLRESAAQVLGVRGSTAAIPLLMRMLATDDNKWVRARCAEALGLIGSPPAIPALRTALSKENDQRVRRSMAQALFRLGQRLGREELMWQIKSGTQNTKAEVMQFLVAMTGQPLGQNADAWWSYFDTQGNMLLARRPGGSPAVLALGGITPQGSAGRQGPNLFAQSLPAWQVVPVVVLALGPSRAPVTRARLLHYEQLHGPIPDGCLLLLRTDWLEAKPARHADQKNPPADAHQVSGTQRVPAQKSPPIEPWLEHEALLFLLQRAPQLLGVGIDASTLDSPKMSDRPARNLLVSRGKLALESLGDMDRIPNNGTRLVLVNLGRSNPANLYRTLALAILP